MAIQISEKGLSLKAKEALKNAKNKSQLMRDALEYYVAYQNDLEKVEKELSEVKSLLISLSSKNSSVSNNDLLEKELIKLEVEKEEVASDLDIYKENDKETKKADNTGSDEGIIDKGKIEIERLIDNSLKNFI